MYVTVSKPEWKKKLTSDFEKIYINISIFIYIYIIDILKKHLWKTGKKKKEFHNYFFLKCMRHIRFNYLCE